MTERWTAETEELVALVMLRVAYESVGDAGASIPDDWAAADPKDREYTLAMVRPFLTALADAGVLLPPGGEVREEWSVWIETNRHERLAEMVGRAYAREDAEAEIARRVSWGRKYPGEVRRRTVHTGGWGPVTTEGAQTDG